MKKTKKETIWEIIYTATFGFLGYALMDAMQRYERNLQIQDHNFDICDNKFNDLNSRLEALESPKEE